jgi:hypothetical protein
MPALTDKSALVPTTTWVNDCIDDNLVAYAPLASPAFTGNPTSITPATTDNDTSIATTAYVKNNLVSYALINSPNLTGTPTISTTPLIGQTTAIANVEYVNNAVAGVSPILTNYAQLNTGTSQTFTGTNIFTNANTSIKEVVYNSLPTLTNVSIFSYTSTTTTTTYSYANSNVNYVSEATLNITNLGVKRFTFSSSYQTLSPLTNNQFTIDNPQINTGGTINYNPSKIVIASWELTGTNYTNYDWSFKMSQPFTLYSTAGTQQCFIIAQLVTIVNNPNIKYYLEVSINSLAQGVNFFNNATYYYINGFSLCWT